MKWSIRKLLLPGVGVAAFVATVVVINQHARVAYPLSTWRMDLDDLLIGLGTIALGIAAIWTVWLKAQEADRKAVAVDKKLNGGLSSIAAQIMRDELRMAGFENDLAPRIEFLEAHYQECLEREQTWKKVEAQILIDRAALRSLLDEQEKWDGTDRREP